MARTGRPSSIDIVVGKRVVDGAEVNVTVSERIISALRAGTPMAGAAASVGVHTDTVYGWMAEGSRINQRLTSARVNRSSLSARERRLADFSVEVVRAMGEWEANANALLEQIMRGGLEVRTITVKVNADGNQVERSEKVERLAPNAGVLQWRLSRLFPDRYSGRVEITGAEGEPLSADVRARNLADSAKEYLAGAAAQRELAAETET